MTHSTTVYRLLTSVLRGVVTLCLLATATAVYAQDKPFATTLYNKEYNIYLVLDFYGRAVTIPDQAFLGTMDGYLGDNEDFRKWFILDSKVVSETVAECDIINTEGSEDLHATITANADGTYTLCRTAGSTLRIARQKKWVKLPKTLTFTREK